MTIKKKKAPKLEALFAEEIKVNENDNNSNSVVTTEVSKNVFKGESKKKVVKSNKTQQTSVYMPVAVKEKLEEIQFSERKTGKNQNDLILEGIDLLLKNRGFPSISDLVKE